jgi:glycosyltransferase involved in cell wall biosynthesis
MRIAQVSTLSAPVAEESTGSVEAWLWLLTRELVRAGHEVTVFAAANSRLPEGAKLIATSPGPYGTNGALDDWQLCEWINLCRAVEMSAGFDVLHSHAYLWGLPLSRLSRAPLVHTTHIVPDENAARLRAAYPEAHVTAISRQQWSVYPNLAPAHVIHHGVDVEQFPFNAQAGDYVGYMGRFVSGKGPRQAIATAKKLGVRLLMAGPRSTYFREQVQPLIDGKSVEYVGFVKGAERARFLGGARALLYPIQYPESFGLVLLESMLCGTPVAAMRIGAVPELLEEGKTGYSVPALDDLPDAAGKCFELDRAAVRRWAEARFSVQLMANRYEQLYQRIVEATASKP